MRTLPTSIKLRNVIVLVGSVAALVPSAARAACTGDWDLSGPWTLAQGTCTVSLNLQQNGTQIGGKAAYRCKGGDFSFDAAANGSISDGSINGNSFTITIDWGGGSVGVYSGVIDPRGSIAGSTFAKSQHGATGSWLGNRTANCRVASTTAPPSSAAPPNSEAQARACAAKGPKWTWQDGKCIGVRVLGTRRSAPSPGQPTQAAAVNPGCKPGFVWRDAKDGDGVCVTPEERQIAKQQNANAANNIQSGGGNTCRTGYVWRNAWDGDGVCVTPYERDQAAKQNQLSSQRSN